MKRFFLKLGIVSVAVYGLILFCTENRGTFMGGPQQVLAIWLGVPLLFFGLFRLVRCSTKNDRPQLEKALCTLAVAAAFAGLAATVPVGRWLLGHDVAQARAFCQELLDDGRIRRGADGLYPTSREAIQLRGRLPRLLKYRDFYHPIDGGREFDLVIRYDFDTAWVYSSATGTWLKRT